MLVDDLKQLLAARPFVPFEIEMSSGQRHELRHPECAVLTKTQMVIVDPERDSVAICQLLHVTSLLRNGSRKRKSSGAK